MDILSTKHTARTNIVNLLRIPPPGLLMFAAVLAASLACGNPPATEQPGQQVVTTTSGGLERSYEIYIPAGIVTDEPAPLVFVFHGYSGNAKAARLISGFNRFANEHKFIAVYPNGTGESLETLSWNGGRCCFYASDHDVDDVGFVSQMVTELSEQYAIDPHRIFAAGMSNGGIFSYRLACELADIFAAVAPVAGSFLYEPCTPSEAVSILHIHGLNDEVVPFDGINRMLELADVGFIPVEEGLVFWAGEDGCTSAPDVSVDGNVTHTAYLSCRDGTAVELYAIAGVSHTWPIIELQSSRIIWEFFETHPKP